MKVYWEVKDIRAGTLIATSLSVEKWIIAYQPSKASPGNLYSLVSLADGLIAQPEGLDKVGLALILNRDHLVPLDFLQTKFGGEGAN